MRYIFYFILLYVLAFSFAIEAREKIGLVLSGGGAKGAAHIGVIKELEAHNIPVDYIAGTSIGAYVGGMYALGYSIEDIETTMLGLSWSDGFSDSIPRESLSYINKQHRDMYNLGIRLGYSDAEFKVPHGLLLGQTAYQLIQTSTDVVGVFTSFDDLAIPYRAVASNIATAEMVVLDSGSINRAMNASAAIPGIVAAVEIDGQMLVDGGITNNMPVDVAKAMGADIIIAVDIGSPLVAQSELTSTVSVVNQLSTILTNNTSLTQKKLLTDKDVLLRPAIDLLGTADWSIMPKALALGEEAARAQLSILNNYSLSDDDYQAYQANKKLKNQKFRNEFSAKIIAINVENNSKVENKVILQYFDVELNKALSKDELNAAINRVFALDKFEQVTVDFINTEAGRIITLHTKAKSWGPNYFDFGFNLRTDFSDRSIATINMSYLLTDMNSYGGRWLNEIELGWEVALSTEFHQPFLREPDLYTRARLAFAQDKWEKTSERDELKNDFYRATLALGYDYSFKGIFEVGAIAEKGELSVDIVGAGRLGYESAGTFIAYGYDTLNSINFPTSGNQLHIELQWLKDKYDQGLALEEDDETLRLTFNWRGAVGIGGHTFVGITSFTTLKNENPFNIHVTELGGFLNLSGYQEDALLGVHSAFAAAVYQYDLGQDVPGGLDLPLYLGTSLEAGNVWNVDEKININELIYSGSVYFGTDTSVGPAALGVGLATDGEYSFFLSVGKNW
ncbi:patatin-like phospholipase family protein [Colwellia sp. E2M01]|uniref:patatin-like phospholipase family protein n=1 Tax=Colwellia sp. E2M01 TaxID=2841561 RepID=UPI001C08FBDD|nr:patatin-like phospholipase family protein [Colwellia sp. E2M01]MBU2871948.1 patatin-like phospholipase family protein [Colwellia sp. E2M01]